MLERLTSLKTLAEAFFARRSRQQGGAKPYYRIIGVGPTLDENPRWDVSFFLSGSPVNPHATCPLSARQLQALLAQHLGADAPTSVLEDRNHYSVTAGSRREARQLARRLVQIFGEAGISPMADDSGRYAPKKPGPSATG